MPIKLNLVINRGQYNQVQRPNIKINQISQPRPTNPTPAPAPPSAPAGITLRRAINAPTGGCKSCGG
jgi:hypothetical protein